LREYHIRFIGPEGALKQNQVTTAATDDDAAARAREWMSAQRFAGCAEVWCGFRRVALVSSSA
jgi:hypothetical protein